MISERLGLFRPRIGFQRLCGFGTKKGELKKPRDLELARADGFLVTLSSLVLGTAPRLPSFPKRI